MIFFLLINVKMTTNVGILTFNERKNSILDLPEPKKAEFLDIFILIALNILCPTELSMTNVLYPRGLITSFFFRWGGGGGGEGGLHVCVC